MPELKYRKKPVVVSAWQWDGSEEEALAIEAAYPEITAWRGGVDDDLYLDISTLEGVMRADPGDYIITGVVNERYPCKAGVFEATYERVEE